jgi:hypothetical protein
MHPWREVRVEHQLKLRGIPSDQNELRHHYLNTRCRGYSHFREA